MNIKANLFLCCILFAQQTLFAASDLPTNKEKKQPAIKLYAIDCGRIDVSNFSEFSDTGEYDNQSRQLADPCYLIVHPKGNLLWDTGLPDTLINKPETAGIYRISKTDSLKNNLSKIKLKLRDINYVSVSHSHFDHMGTLSQLADSTWILQKSELDYAQKHANAFFIDPSTLAGWKTAKKQFIEGDFDVFKDGTVKILNTKGHTPGHQSLQIKLPKSGVVILSGDLVHQKSSLNPLKVPTFNTDRADTLASAARIKTILKNTHGRLIIQHDKQDFAKMPKFPNYME